MQQCLVNWFIQRYQRAIQADPDQQKPWTKLWAICVKESRQPEFIAFCQGVIRSRPSSPPRVGVSETRHAE